MSDSSEKTGLVVFKRLLQSREYSFSFAQKQQQAYYESQGKVVPEDERFLPDSQVAANLAGLYALECGVGYLASRDSKTVVDVLRSVSEGDLNSEDKELLCRFANATWKAGQPFLGLERISREVFVPFDLLPEDEKQKDWVQIQNAAYQVLLKVDFWEE